MKISFLIVFTLTFSNYYGQDLYSLYIARIESYVSQGNYEKADFYIEKAIERYPDSSECYFQRGGNHLFKRQFDLALADFNKAIELGYPRLNIYKFRGVAHQAKKNFQQAEKDFVKFLPSSPQDTFIQIRLATVIFDQGRRNESKEMISTFETHNPTFIDGYLLKGMIAHDEEKVEESIFHFDKAIVLDTLHALSYYLRAQSHKALSNKIEACEDLLKSQHLGRYEDSYQFHGLGCYEILDFKSPDSPYEYPLPPPEDIIIEEE